MATEIFAAVVNHQQRWVDQCISSKDRLRLGNLNIVGIAENTADCARNCRVISKAINQIPLALGTRLIKAYL